MATHSSILPWRVPWTGESGGLQSIGSQRSDLACTHTHTHLANNRLPRWRSDRESACQGRRSRRHGYDPWVGMIPWRRKWQPTPVFLPGKTQEQRSLVGYRPWGHKELVTSELLSMNVSFMFIHVVAYDRSLSLLRRLHCVYRSHCLCLSVC